MIFKKFEGNICLSNPQYDLYVDYGQVALGEAASDLRRRMRSLMDFVPALDRPVSVRAVAEHIGLPEEADSRVSSAVGRERFGRPALSSRL